MNLVLKDNEVAACPECDAAAVQTRSAHLSPEDTDRYRCGTCGATFGSYTVRARRGHSGKSGLSRRLLEADPDEVSK